MRIRWTGALLALCAFAPHAAAQAAVALPPVVVNKPPTMEPLPRVKPAVRRAASDPARRIASARPRSFPQGVAPRWRAATAPRSPPPPAASAAVVPAAPLAGADIALDKSPANTTLVDTPAFDHARFDGLADALRQKSPSVTLEDVSGNPNQPDLEYRGFVASPVLGKPQGLAVYQNGVRINEVLGDTVNFDLIPEAAISRVALAPNNPAFGLNAIGGALAIDLKTGFDWQGREVELRGGSFGQVGVAAQAGAKGGNVAAYAAVERAHDAGWRDRSGSEVARVYADVGWRGQGGEAHVSVSSARSLLGAAATTPEGLLRQRWSSVYTTPQTTRNDMTMVSVSGRADVTDWLSIQSLGYVRSFRQAHVDGNTSDVAPCDDPANAGLLCLGDDVLTSTTNAAVPDVYGGATLGSLDRTRTTAQAFGASLQAISRAPLFERSNRLTVGASLDHGSAEYRASSELGVIGPNLFVTGVGVVIDQPTGDIAPVDLRTRNIYAGAYAIDNWDFTNAFSVFVGGRYNSAQIRLEDPLGAALDGTHAYARFNPVVGASYALTPEITAYAGYSEANRAPTPIELGCADPSRPCLIDNFVLSDPSLRQVVSRSLEAGLRGHAFFAAPSADLTWNAGLFRSDLSDDILNVASPIAGRGYFLNAGGTRRQGLEAGVAWRREDLSVSASYALVDATFRSAITLASPNNPAAIDGLIQVAPGDRIPAIPRQRFKANVEYALAPSWRVGGELVAVSGQYLVGDESNLNPRLPGYAVVNLFTTYRLGSNVELFGRAQNVFERRYVTYGSFFDTTAVAALHFVSPRSLAPASPLALTAGVKATF